MRWVGVVTALIAAGSATASLHRNTLEPGVPANAARFQQVGQQFVPIIDKPEHDMVSAPLVLPDTKDPLLATLTSEVNQYDRSADDKYLSLGELKSATHPAHVANEPAAASKSSNPVALLETQTETETGASAQEGGGDDANADLNTALEEIKADIVLKSKQVLEEKAWVDQVLTIVKSYELKMERVNVNIQNLRLEIKGLYKKKRQIENLILQQKLEAKLKDANADLSTLDAAINHVKTKEESFSKNRGEVSKTINVIQQQLDKLRGKTETAEGEAAAANPEAAAAAANEVGAEAAAVTAAL